MQPIRPLFYVRGSVLHPAPLEPGTALYCRIYVSEYGYKDFKWNQSQSQWEESDYLGRLLSRGEPDLDQVSENDIPGTVPWPKI